MRYTPRQRVGIRGCMGLADSGITLPIKYREIVADKLGTAGWSVVELLQRHHTARLALMVDALGC